MNLKSFLTLRTFGIVILGMLLALTCVMVWKIHQLDTESQGEEDAYSMFVNQYKIDRSSRWNRAFDQLSVQKYTTIGFEQKENILVIGEKYIAQIGHQGQHYDQPTITNVLALSKQPSQSQLFLARSQTNQQLFYLPEQPSRIDSSQTKHKTLKKCLQLDNIDLTQKLHYFVDATNKFWLVSHPHNNVVMVQVYDCEKGQRVKKIIHQPIYKGRKYMVNELVEVRQVQSQEGQDKKGFVYEIRLLTYETHDYVIQVKSDQLGDTYSITNISLTPSHSLTSQQLPITKTSPSSQSSSLITYLFADPLNKIFQQQFNHLVLSVIKDFTEEVRQLLGGLGVDTKTVNAFVRDKLKEYEREKVPEYLDYDVQLFDENNDCIVNLQYHLPQANSTQEQTNSSLTRLNTHLLTTRTPVFHDIDNYDKYDIVEILKNQKTPSVKQFKRLAIQKGYQKQYTSNYFQSVYETSPDSKVHFLGLGEKVFYLHPKENVREEDYLSVRTKQGGLIMQGSKIKGVYEDRPLSKHEQVRQKYFIQGNQVLPGIYEAHSGYQSLYSVLNGNKVQLINGLSGKTMLTYTINTKVNQQYTNSYLFNNEWWVVTFNPQTKLSELTKHQLYLQKSYPKQIDAVKRTYGKIDDSQFAQGEDDLATIFKEYLYLTGDRGIVVLDVFRCLDEFYYVQIADASGDNYTIARVHYKRLSNRQPKTSKTYNSQLEQRLVVQPKQMVKEKQKTDPFLIILSGRQFFSGIDVLIKQNKFSFRNYSVKNGDQETVISSMQKMNQFEFLPYVLLSRQEITGGWTDQVSSKQEILLMNMRVLIENGKKKFMVETRQLARTRVKYFGVFVGVILFSLIIKLAISEKLKRIREEDNKQGENRDKNDKNDKEQKDSSSAKSKNKKEKTK